MVVCATLKLLVCIAPERRCLLTGYLFQAVVSSIALDSDGCDGGAHLQKLRASQDDAWFFRMVICAIQSLLVCFAPERRCLVTGCPFQAVVSSTALGDCYGRALLQKLRASHDDADANVVAHPTPPAMEIPTPVVGPRRPRSSAARGGSPSGEAFCQSRTIRLQVMGIFLWSRTIPDCVSLLSLAAFVAYAMGNSVVFFAWERSLAQIYLQGNTGLPVEAHHLGCAHSCIASRPIVACCLQHIRSTAQPPQSPKPPYQAHRVYPCEVTGKLKESALREFLMQVNTIVKSKLYARVSSLGHRSGAFQAAPCATKTTLTMSEGT